MSQYNQRIGLTKAAKDTGVTAAIISALAGVTYLSDPTVLQPLLALVPPPWNAAALVLLPSLLKGVTNFLANKKKHTRPLGKGAVAAARDEYFRG